MRFTAFVLFVASGVLVASAGPVASAPVPKHLMKEPEGDKGKLQGKWKLQSLRLGEQDLGNIAASIEMVLEFRDDKMTFTVKQPGANNQMQKSTATVALDSKAKHLKMTN